MYRFAYSGSNLDMRDELQKQCLYVITVYYCFYIRDIRVIYLN